MLKQWQVYSLKGLAFAIIAAISLTNSNLQAKPDKGLPLEEMQQFTRVINHIKTHYVKDTSDRDLFESAIRGMLAGLDPHSAYLNDEDYEDLRVSTTGKFGGLGIEVTMENGFVKVVSPIDDTPAAKAGVQSGDLIIRLDGTPVKGLSLRDAVNIMRGEKGSPIDLTLIREGTPQPLELTIIRDIIKVASTKHKLYDQRFGYIRVSHFQTSTASNIRAAIDAMEKEAKNHLHGLVLDLRNNPGGVLEGAIQVSEIFLDSKNIGYQKLIVYTEGKSKSSRVEEVATQSDRVKGIPIVVLVNEGSASASEIVAGALQDHNRAIIMGQSTFGKGSVQTVLPLTRDSGLKLTTAFYYTPSGRSIQAEGIVPDIMIENLQVESPKEQGNYTIKEADLQGHLETAADAGNKKTDRTEGLSLSEKDYPLYEALNVLKGLAIYHRK